MENIHTIEGYFGYLTYNLKGKYTLIIHGTEGHFGYFTY